MHRLPYPLVIVGLLVTFLTIARPMSVSGMPVAGQHGPYRAALVVQFADKTVATRCVSFSEPAITGADLLNRSGLQVAMDYNAGLGGAICSINQEGCAFPTESCFCRCQGMTCEYWAYYHGSDAGWQYSQVGASGYQVKDGALEGWSWGPGNFSSGTEPPQIAFDQVCGEEAAAPSPPTAAPTALDGSAPPVGSFLAPVVHAQENALADSAPVQSAQPTSAYAAQLPAYAAYFLLLTALVGAALRVVDRKKKAAGYRTR